MAQDPTKRDKLLLINAGMNNQQGLWARANSATSQYIANNTLLRNNWETVDRFRGVQGHYLGVLPYQGSDASDDGALVWNFNNEQHIVGGSMQNILRPLHRTSLGPAQEADHISHGRFYQSKYLLEPNHADWNDAANTNHTHDLLKTFVQDPGINEGDPYYGKFLENGFIAGDKVNSSLSPIFNRQGHANAFLDHTFRYLKPSENLSVRLSGGVDIQVKPVYNFYLDTSPAYEDVTANTPESLLPNFYIFEAELRNTGSEAYADDYYQSITLFERITDWFVQDNNGGYSESHTKSYYQSYASQMQRINENATDLAAVTAQFTSSLKNVVVLHSDIDAINKLTRADKKTSGLSFLPFYNVVTVGQDEFASTTGEFEQASSFFQGLDHVTGFDNTSFLDLLQMYIITFLEAGAPAPATFHEVVRGIGGHPQGNTGPSTTITSSLYVDLSRPLGGGASIPGLPDMYQGFVNHAFWLRSRIAHNNSQLGVTDFAWKRDNLVLIRDYADDGRWTATAQKKREFDAPDPAAAGDFYDQVDNNNIKYPVRNFESVLSCAGAHSETLLYKIDKRVVDKDGNIDPTIVQTIYLSRRISDPGPLQYIDSQVRYGVRYQYDIQEIRVVFGNKYYYDDLKLYYAGYAGYGRAVGNALGFYRATSPEIKADTYAAAISNFSYTNNTSDTSFSEIQRGYFAIDPEEPLHQLQWNWAASGSDWGDCQYLARVKLFLRRGYGFDGNQDGGVYKSSVQAPIAFTMGASSIVGDYPGDVDLFGQTEDQSAHTALTNLGYLGTFTGTKAAQDDFLVTSTLLQLGGSSGGPNLPPVHISSLFYPDAAGAAAPGGCTENFFENSAQDYSIIGTMLFTDLSF